MGQKGVRLGLPWPSEPRATELGGLAPLGLAGAGSSGILMQKMDETGGICSFDPMGGKNDWI